MIRLRQAIERGMRHRWLGPLFVLLFCLLLAMLYMHSLHDGQAGTELGELCLGITMIIGAVLLIRVGFTALPGSVLVRLGRAPPACPARRQLARPSGAAAAIPSVPLRL